RTSRRPNELPCGPCWLRTWWTSDGPFTPTSPATPGGTIAMARSDVAGGCGSTTSFPTSRPPRTCARPASALFAGDGRVALRDLGEDRLDGREEARGFAVREARIVATFTPRDQKSLLGTTEGHVGESLFFRQFLGAGGVVVG